MQLPAVTLRHRTLRAPCNVFGAPKTSSGAASQAVDPVPFPELGKADTRSGKGSGSTACRTRRLSESSGDTALTKAGRHPMPDDSHGACSLTVVERRGRPFGAVFVVGDNGLRDQLELLLACEVDGDVDEPTLDLQPLVPCLTRQPVTTSVSAR
jgi:hypothetical protein